MDRLQIFTLANLLTCANLLCGCLGIIAVLKGNLQLGSFFILGGAGFDFLDGMAARWMGTTGNFGKELDSLADVVTFGTLPGIILYEMTLPYTPYGAYITLIVPVFSALRLAKFNLDERQKNTFIGMPTPATALLISSMPFIIDTDWLGKYHWYVVIGSVVVAVLLLAEIPLLSLKFSDLKWVNNQSRYLLICVSLLCILLVGFKAVPLIYLFYLLLSFIENNRKHYEIRR